MVSDLFAEMREPDGLSITERELFDRLVWFIRIRWFMGVLALMLLLSAWSILGVRFRQAGGEARLSPAADCILVVFLYNAVFTFLQHVVSARRKVSRRVIIALALGQIACDSLAVCALVHYTGGVENYFIIVILLPLVIAAELLPSWLAYTAAFGTAVLANALAYGELWGVIPHVSVSLESAGGSEPLAAVHVDVLYVAEVTGALTAMMFMIVFIGSSIASRLRDREAQLDQAYRRLSDVDEAKGFFMRKAGHEMRSPLAAMSSILDAVAVGADSLDQRNRAGIARARARINALMELVMDLRRYAWLRSPAGAGETCDVCLDETVDAVVEQLSPGAETRDIAITAMCAAPVRVCGNEEMLRELIGNLLANAIQYTPRGGHIELSLSVKEGSAVLRVADTGIGISGEAEASLFQEFYRSPEARRHLPDGTGLGLAIARRIAELHRGEIGAQNRPGGGAVFVVSLPLADPAPG